MNKTKFEKSRMMYWLDKGIQSWLIDDFIEIDKLLTEIAHLLEGKDTLGKPEVEHLCSRLKRILRILELDIKVERKPRVSRRCH